MTHIDRVLDARIRAGLPPMPSCSSCPKTSVGYRSSPDGTVVAWCADHRDSPQQTSLMEGA